MGSEIRARFRPAGCLSGDGPLSVGKQADRCSDRFVAACQLQGSARILVYTSYQRLEALLDSDRKHWVSVAAAIVDGDRVLAIRRRDNDKWEPPGGTLEPDETVLDGLRREVLEETGMAIGQPRLSGIYKNMTRAIVALVFRCEHDGQVPKATSEAIETAWLNAAEIRERLDPAYAYRLLDALNAEAEIAIRIHDGVDLADS